MLKKVLFASILIIVILTLAILSIYHSRRILFHDVPWIMAIAVILGIISGIFRGIRYNTATRKSNYQPNRHTIDSFIEHWGTAMGIFVLMVSGFFIKFDYKRLFSMNLHFVGLVTTLFFGTYFLTHFLISKKYNDLIPNTSDIVKGTIKKYLFKSAWQDTGKYLSSQKSAFLLFLLLGIGIFVTGALKVDAFYFSVPTQLIQSATRIHDIFAGLFILMFLVHIFFAVAPRSHRRLVKSLFTGKN